MKFASEKKQECKLTVWSQLYLSAIISYMFRLHIPRITRLNT